MPVDEAVLVRFKYYQLNRAGKGMIRRYIEKLSGYSRAKVSRLIREYNRRGQLSKAQYRRHGFPEKYTAAGKPYENATMESFLKTLKYEEVSLCEYDSFEDVLTKLPYFIEQVYNQKRLHSTLGYRPPNEFEEALLNRENNGAPHQTLLTLTVQS